MVRKIAVEGYIYKDAHSAAAGEGGTYFRGVVHTEGDVNDVNGAFSDFVETTNIHEVNDDDDPSLMFNGPSGDDGDLGWCYALQG